MKLKHFAAAGLVPAAAFLALTATPSSAQLVTQRSLSVAQAFKIVNAAMAHCRTANMGEITIAVVDRAGDVKMLVAADNSNPHNLDLARRKAYTARTFRRTSLDWAARSAPDQPQAGQRSLFDVIPLGGGVPVLAGMEAVGGVGVSGSTGGQPGDEACAKAGADAIAAELR
jgi:uncharacterized protein GlcG (DUF336 family)